jgi:hypothetical protein
MKIGSLCTGYGGLDLAVESYFNAEMVWCSEIDKYASKVIDARFNKPNLGDLKTIDWSTVEPIDIITAGYPCQPFSHAGQRKAQKMSDIYGHILLKPLAYYDQNTLSWKTCEDILALDLRKFSATLPKMGMMLNGVLYEQVMSELLTKEPDSSLLPTPTAGDHKYRIKGNSQASKNLQALAKQNLLPTPTAMHVRNHDEPIEKYQQRVQDFNEGKTLGKPGASTGVAVRLWQHRQPISGTTGKCRNWGADLFHDVKCTCKQYRMHWSMVN